MNPTKVLIYVEDPGACNYLKGLPQALLYKGISAKLLAYGPSVSYLSSRNVEFDEIAAGSTAEMLLQEHRPEVVIVGTSEQRETLAHNLADVCKEQGIVCIGAVDMQSNAALRFRGTTDSALAHAPEWLMVPDKACQLEFEKLGFPHSKIFAAGHPQFDYVRALASELRPRRTELRRRILPEAAIDAFVISFLCEGYDLLNRSASMKTSDYTLHGRGQTNFRTAIVLEELLDAISELEPKPFFVARLHPKMVGDELSHYNGEVDYWSLTEDPLELLTISDLVVGMSSMLLQEAAIMERPTLSILPKSSERQWLPVTANGITPVVFTREELRQFLTDFVRCPRLANSAIDISGNALDNIVQFISQRLQQSTRAAI
ncbi:MAG TPA: hypothetical protein V6C97_32000 [Oculatellaceae cyanobacterium]